MAINLKNIKSREDLKKVLKFLEDEGFGYTSDSDFHKKKVDKTISNYNKLNIKYDDHLKNDLSKVSDYDQMEKDAENYFSKFGVDDKIFEIIQKFRFPEDEKAQTPSAYPNKRDIVAWVKFKNKYDLKDDYQANEYFYVYNFDKNFLKFYFPEYSEYEFKRLYELIMQEKCNDNFDSRTFGNWQDLGKIEIKFFKNRSATIKGDIGKFKDYYYKYEKNQKYGNIILIKNKTKEFFRNKNN